MKTTIRHFVELELIIEADVSPYDPGQTTGPPESCYPPEGGEVEISDIRLAVMAGETLPDGFAAEFGEIVHRLMQIRPKLMEEIEEECAEVAACRDQCEHDDAA